jgi:hypothetical protein
MLPREIACAAGIDGPHHLATLLFCQLSASPQFGYADYKRVLVKIFDAIRGVKPIRQLEK